MGVGSGPQEIAQFLISHMEPGMRSEVEAEVVQEYYRALTTQNPGVAESMSYEQLLNDNSVTLYMVVSQNRGTPISLL